MKHTFSLFGLLLLAFSAQTQTEFKAVDAIARGIRKDTYSNPGELARALCKDLKTDSEKARVLFTWLALNMRYDLDAAGKEGPKANSEAEYHDKRVKIAFRKGKGVCMDYALLYQQMAREVELECAFILGNSKGSLLGGWESHAWNAVKIEGQWKLLDVTWGAGHVDEQQKFKQVFQPGYFFTEPRVFALDHFPEEAKWQLLDNPIPKNTFKNQAVFHYGNPDQDIQDTEPFGIPLSKGTDGKVFLFLKIKHPPAVLKLEMGGRNLPFHRTDKDGWTMLHFVASGNQPLYVWGGEKRKNRVFVTLMGVFPIK